MGSSDEYTRGRVAFKNPVTEQPKVVEAPKPNLLAGVTITRAEKIAVIGLDAAQQNAYNTHKAVWNYLQGIAQA